MTVMFISRSLVSFRMMHVKEGIERTKFIDHSIIVFYGYFAIILPAAQDTWGGACLVSNSGVGGSRCPQTYLDIMVKIGSPSQIGRLERISMQIARWHNKMLLTP